MKSAGCEAAVLDALHRHGVAGRALVSSRLVRVLDRLKRLDPAVHTGISIGGRLARRSQNWQDWRTAVLDGIAGGRFDALMANHRLAGQALVDAVRDRGGEIHCWTVDSRAVVARLESLGVSGITTNDPRVFAPVGAA